MFADDFPSIPGRSINQEMLFQAGASIPIDNYLTIEFPPSFKDIYGTPVIYYRAWERLMNITFRPKIKLKIKQSFLQFASHTTYLDYCKMVDVLMAKNNLSLVDREQMDAAWVQQLVLLYNLDRKVLNELLGYKLGHNHVLGDVEEVDEAMKTLLEQAVREVGFPSSIMCFILAHSHAEIRSFSAYQWPDYGKGREVLGGQGGSCGFEGPDLEHNCELPTQSYRSIDHRY